MTEIPKTYDPKQVEPRWYAAWERSRLFEASEASSRPPFSMAIPPPNITGSLHMGHALNNTLQDVLLRFYRLQGYEGCWVPGTDHGGIATQNVVEKQLLNEGRSRTDLGREAFLRRLWSWKEECGDTILHQLKRLGCALDWSRKRFTLEDPCAQAVLEAFRLFWEQGLLYRERRMVNWCVRCGTALSDIEVEHEDRQDKLYYVRYPSRENPGDFLVVATTRPETILADMAVAVHPEDARYQGWIGRRLLRPLNPGGKVSEIAVVADEGVDREFGTGALKVTPGHDPLDYEIAQRHNLYDFLEVIGLDGRMREHTGPPFAGSDRFEARRLAEAALREKDLLEKEEPYRHSVGVCYRCGEVIEPLLSYQWFLRMGALIAPAIEAAREGRLRFYPESWRQPYLQWLENLKDWCLSRQIWWGHRIPVYYCGNCHQDELFFRPDPKSAWSRHSPTVVGSHRTPAGVYGSYRGMREALGAKAYQTALQGADRMWVRTPRGPMCKLEAPARCETCSGTEIFQDPDVLDTWFSSALWPFSIWGWPKSSRAFQKFYPTHTLVTGYEILYLWVARMVLFGCYFLKREPFARVLIHGIVRDAKGKKMSKSLGNVVDPLEVIDRFGADALRFSLIQQAVPGRDIQCTEDSWVGARNFANKLYNVSRFVQMQLSGARPVGPDRASLAHLADRWILSRLCATQLQVGRSYGECRLDEAARCLYSFVWDDFCDWYVEFAKLRTPAPLSVLLEVLSRIFRLLHPMMPFLTEDLWHRLFPVSERDFLLNSAWPRSLEDFSDPEAERRMQHLQEVIGAIRTLRHQMRLSPVAPLEAHCLFREDSLAELFAEHAGAVKRLARLQALYLLREEKKPPHCATLLVSGGEIFVPLGGQMDVGRERARLEESLQAMDQEVVRLDARLSNRSFLDKAPAREVEKVRSRKRELETQRQGILRRLASVQ
ncbi:MAG: valine--tRNA ligase [Elusimicrobia bacterium]|nr:valine--tRNA ligase [Elusimicrobiota bacterium]